MTNSAQWQGEFVTIVFVLHVYPVVQRQVDCIFTDSNKNNIKTDC